MIFPSRPQESLQQCLQRACEIQQQHMALLSEAYCNSFQLQTVLSGTVLQQFQEMIGYWNGEHERLAEKWANQVEDYNQRATHQMMDAGEKATRKNADAVARTAHELKAVPRSGEAPKEEKTPTKAEKALAHNKRHVTSAA